MDGRVGDSPRVNKCEYSIPPDLRLFLEKVSTHSQRIVLVIDEFEEIPPDVFDGIMHTFRALYHKRREHRLHVLVLAGVSTVVDLILDSASPFNIADQVKIPYFSLAEVQELINMHVAESGQTFDEEVVHAVYTNTNGQPGLVNALCYYLTNQVVPDRSRPVTSDASNFEQASRVKALQSDDA